MEDMEQSETRVKSLTISEIMTPDMVNFAGNIHGGHLLLLLDRVAYACAVQYTLCNVVTLSVDHVFFKQPIFVGDLVTFYAQVNFVGKTSMEIGIRVLAQDLKKHVKRHAMTCYFTMVAVDEQGKPTVIPSLVLNDEMERQRFEDAKMRRDHRMEYYQKHYQGRK